MDKKVNVVPIHEGSIYCASSEEWHRKTFGDPEECFKPYCDSKEHNKYGKDTVYEYIDLLKYGYDGKHKKQSDHVNRKYKSIANMFGNIINGNVLDIGSPGIADMFLLRLIPNIDKIVCIDGNKYAVEAFRPHLDPKIESICCDFSWFPECDSNFDTILQIDFPEHITDDLYIKITTWALSKMKNTGKLVIYTPEFPNCVNQMEHISVKSLGFYLKLFLNMNLFVTYKIINGRIYMVVFKNGIGLK